MLWMMRALILRLPLPVARMHMTEKWGDEQQRPLLLNLCDAQKSDETRWTELKADNGDVAMSERTPKVVGRMEALWAVLYTAVHKSPPPLFVLPRPLSFPKRGWGTVTW